MTDLIYIHGFNSSPRSQKAQETRVWLAKYQPQVRLHVPALPYDPASALALLSAAVAQCVSAPVLVGSSLGGFMASVLSERYGLRAALINPAVYPHRLLPAYLGQNTNPYTGEQYVLTAQHMTELEAMTPARLSAPTRTLVLLQSGDETLDYRQAVRFYRGSPMSIEPGGSHAYENFAARLPDIYAFLNQ